MWKVISHCAKRALNEMKNRDDKAIRSAYQSLFNCILVGDQDEKGVRNLSFVLTDGHYCNQFELYLRWSSPSRRRAEKLFKYQQIAPAVQRLAGLGMNNNQIAVELGVDRKMVKKARIREL